MNALDEIKIRANAAVSLLNNPDTFPITEILELTQLLFSHLVKGGRVAFVGNGGSAAEAIHLAAEFTGKCVNPHPPVSALCLNESQSAITAIANDFGIDEIFSRQVQAHLREGDFLIALSTSGKSPNILKALSTAKTIGVNCYLWTGDVDVRLTGIQIWKVPSVSTPRIQEVHLMWGHIIAETFELLWEA
jgi:D-sedoheptulose 7-phosphate isomerase